MADRTATEVLRGVGCGCWPRMFPSAPCPFYTRNQALSNITCIQASPEDRMRGASHLQILLLLVLGEWGKRQGCCRRDIGCRLLASPLPEPGASRAWRGILVFLPMHGVSLALTLGLQFECAVCILC